MWVSVSVATRPLARHEDRAGNGDDQQDRGELEGEHVVAVQVHGELADVGVGIPGVARRRHAVTRVDGQRIAGTNDRRTDQADETDAHDRGKWPLDRDRLDREVHRLVDAEQHDDEQEQHDDRAGVHDDLHRGEEGRFHARRTARRRRTA